MSQFPKKYNCKNTKLNKTEDKLSKKIYSRLFPSDQKTHPWCLFSIFMQDYYRQINSWFSNKLEFNIDFGLSSKRYSKLNNKNINLKQIQLDLKKQLKQNKRFLDKLGFCGFYDQNNFILSEEFNIFLRKVFVDLYQSWKIFTHKEVVAWSKDLQTNILKSNIKVQKKPSKEFIMKYFIESKWVTITVPTKNIETIFADVAVAVNPQDKRYKKLIWQNVIIPIINKSIPIIWDDSVDSFQWSWVVRVTPWHDEYWLQIAQSHKLPIDVFAIDTDWNFTNNAWEFSWKPVNEFIENVIKYIDDIWNLDYTEDTTNDFLFYSKSEEELYKITLDQWNIKYDYALDFLMQQIENKNININSISNEIDVSDYLNNLSYLNISNKSINGVLIPIVYSENWDIFPINDDIFLQQYKLSRSKKDITLTLIILNLILDNQIDDKFNLEKLIDALFDFDFSNQKDKISKYIQIYENHNNSDFKKWLKDLKKFLWKIQNDFEKIKIFSEILENSFAIKKDWENFNLDFSVIFWSTQRFFLQRNDSFNKDFLDSLLFLFKNNISISNWDYSNIKNLWNIFMWTFDDIEFTINSLLFSLEYSKIIIFSDLFFYPNLTDQKSNKINNYNSKFLTKEVSETLDLFWPDLIRLLFLTWKKDDWDILLDTSSINNLNFLLNKIWNANRYVYSKYLDWNKKIKTKDIFASIGSDVNDYDGWILHWIKSLLSDLRYQIQENKIMDISKKVLNFIVNDICDKYLESTKLYFDDNTINVTLFSFIVSLKLLKPIVPLFVQELESIYSNKISDDLSDDLLQIDQFVLKEKNYKVNIFMDIVDKLKKIKVDMDVKKHEVMNVFVQANPEFINFLSENESLFKVLLNVNNIEYVRLHENVPDWYQIDNVININIWAKKVANQIEVTKDTLSEMQDDLNTKKEHLQHIKSLVASIAWTAPIDIITKKKQEISSLQLEIEELELSINKLKIKN